MRRRIKSAMLMIIMVCTSVCEFCRGGGGVYDRFRRQGDYIIYT